MKKQNTLVEDRVRKEALKMTIVFMVFCLIGEAVLVAIMLFAEKYMNGLAVDEMTIFIISVYLNFGLAIGGYFDFKKIVIESQKNSKDDETTE